MGVARGAGFAAVEGGVPSAAPHVMARGPGKAPQTATESGLASQDSVSKPLNEPNRSDNGSGDEDEPSGDEAGSFQDSRGDEEEGKEYSDQEDAPMELADVVQLAYDAHLRRFTLGALCCPCYMVAGPNSRRRLEQIMSSPYYTVATLLVTLFAIVASEGVSLLGASDLDTAVVDSFVTVILLVSFVVLMVDLTLASTVSRKIIMTLPWWMDLLAVLSILFELPFGASHWEVGLMSSTWPADRVGLDASIANTINLSPVMQQGRRVLRLLRLMRFFRLNDWILGAPLWARAQCARVGCFGLVYGPKAATKAIARHRTHRLLNRYNELRAEEGHTSRAGRAVTEAIQLKMALIAVAIVIIMTYLTTQVFNHLPVEGLQTLDNAFMASGANDPSQDSLLANLADRYVDDLSSEGDLLLLRLGGEVIVDHPVADASKLIEDGSIFVMCIGFAGEVVSRTLSSQPESSQCRSEAWLDVSVSARQAALVSLMQQGAIMFLLLIQSVLMSYDVDTKLVRPLERISAKLRPVYGAAIQLLQAHRWMATPDERILAAHRFESKARRKRLLRSITASSLATAAKAAAAANGSSRGASSNQVAAALEDALDEHVTAAEIAPMLALAAIDVLRTNLRQHASAAYSRSKFAQTVWAKSMAHGGLQAATDRYSELQKQAGGISKLLATAHSSRARVDRTGDRQGVAAMTWESGSEAMGSVEEASYREVQQHPERIAGALKAHALALQKLDRLLTQVQGEGSGSTSSEGEGEDEEEEEASKPAGQGAGGGATH